MKTLLVLVPCLLCCASLRAQSATVDVDVTLASPGASCAFTVMADLGYGTVTKPASGTGSVTISAVTGARSSNNATVSGTGSVGQVRLQGQHTSSYTVSRTFPSTLTRSSASLSFSGAWAESTSASSGYTSISSSSYSNTAGGAGTSFTRYFRFGGTVGGIQWGDADGDYSGSITTSATCN